MWDFLSSARFPPKFKSEKRRFGGRPPSRPPSTDRPHSSSSARSAWRTYPPQRGSRTYPPQRVARRLKSCGGRTPLLSRRARFGSPLTSTHTHGLRAPMGGRHRLFQLFVQCAWAPQRLSRGARPENRLSKTRAVAARHPSREYYSRRHGRGAAYSTRRPHALASPVRLRDARATTGWVRTQSVHAQVCALGQAAIYRDAVAGAGLGKPMRDAPRRARAVLLRTRPMGWRACRTPHNGRACRRLWLRRRGARRQLRAVARDEPDEQRALMESAPLYWLGPVGAAGVEAECANGDFLPLVVAMGLVPPRTQ